MLSPSPRLALGIAALSAALVVPPAVVASTTAIVAQATVDGELGSTEITHHNDRYVDQIDLGARRSWIHSFTTTWTAGVKYSVPLSHQKSVEVATIETTPFKHGRGKHVIGENGSADEEDSTLTGLRLPAGRNGNTVRLTPDSGIGSIRAVISGGVHPSITVTGIPKNVAKVEFKTVGTTGIRILQQIPGCGAGVAPPRATTVAHLADGTTGSATTAIQTTVCTAK